MLKEKLKNKTFLIISLIITSILGIIFLVLSFLDNKDLKITYVEKSDLDYQVYLKENEFYEKEYLDKDMLYIASLIDKINIDFKYNFNINNKENINFYYDIKVKLVITDDNDNNYYEKDYVLLDTKKVSMTNDENITINERINIDYDLYNDLANNFKSIYNLNANSKLIIDFNVKKQVVSDDTFFEEPGSKMNIKIPLSIKSVNIAMDYQNINEKDKLVSISQYNIYLLIISLFLIVLASIFEYFLIKLIYFSKDKYDKYVSKILKEYDRVIIDSNSRMSFKNKEILNIDNFLELVDVRDNLKLPIMHYKDKDNTYFYVIYGNTVYSYHINRLKFNEDK